MMTGKDKDDSLDARASKPHVGFLFAAAISAGAVAATYVYQEEIMDAGGAIAFAFLLGLLVMITLILLLFYRIPRLGNRLLGYDVVLTSEMKREKSSLQYAGSFKVQTGLDEKRMNSRRKSTRATRKRMAAVTREMQADKKNDSRKDDQ